MRLDRIEPSGFEILRLETVEIAVVLRMSFCAHIHRLVLILRQK